VWFTNREALAIKLPTTADAHLRPAYRAGAGLFRSYEYDYVDQAAISGMLVQILAYSIC
jgi:hypothetical protein